MASSWLYIHIKLDQFWLCGNSILGLHYIDEIMVMKTMVEMTNCYFKSTMWKVAPITNTLSKTFLKGYTPHSNNSIDKAMIPFKGRLSLKQYLRMKPIKRGIKVWTRTDSTNGYVLQFQVYLGKVGGNSEMYLGDHVVKNLTTPLV